MLHYLLALVPICLFNTLFAPAPLLPPGTTRIADVAIESWTLIGIGFLVELAIMWFLLRREESLIKVLGVTIFMNAISIFMGTVTVSGTEVVAAQLLHLPNVLVFALIYFVAVITSVFVEALIALKLFPSLDRFKLILLLTLANMASIGAGMYGIWITKL